MPRNDVAGSALLALVLVLVLVGRGAEQLLEAVDPFGEPRPVAGEGAFRTIAQRASARRRWLLCRACHRHRHLLVAPQRDLLRLLALLLLLFRCERCGGAAAALAVEIGD